MNSIELASRQLRPEPKLGSEAVLSRIADLAQKGFTLAQIRAQLAAPMPEGFGIQVSRVGIFKRLEAAGIKLKNESIRPKTIAPSYSPEALALSKREISKEDLAKFKASKPGRDESWLAPFAKEIYNLIQEGYSYRVIWDVMALKYQVVPQFGQTLTDKKKTDTLADFIRRQRKKQESKPRTRRLFQSRTLQTQPDSVQSPAAPATKSTQAQVTYQAPQAKTRASLPTQGANVAQLLAERALLRESERAKDSEALAELHRKHGVKKIT